MGGTDGDARLPEPLPPASQPCARAALSQCCIRALAARTRPAGPSPPPRGAKPPPAAFWPRLSRDPLSAKDRAVPAPLGPHGPRSLGKGRDHPLPSWVATRRGAEARAPGPRTRLTVGGRCWFLGVALRLGTGSERVPARISSFGGGKAEERPPQATPSPGPSPSPCGGGERRAPSTERRSPAAAAGAPSWWRFPSAFSACGSRVPPSAPGRQGDEKGVQWGHSAGDSSAKGLVSRGERLGDGLRLVGPGVSWFPGFARTVHFPGFRLCKGWVAPPLGRHAGSFRVRTRWPPACSCIIRTRATRIARTSA